MFQTLIILRNSILHEMGEERRQGPLAAHHLFPDNTVRDMVRLVPTTLEEFTRIENIGACCYQPALSSQPLGSDVRSICRL